MNVKKPRGLSYWYLGRLVRIVIIMIVLTACRGQATGGETPAAQQLPTATQPAPISATATEPPAVSTSLAPSATAGSGPAAAPAIECTPPASPSPALTEGPYYTPGTPERTSLLEPGVVGDRLELTGYVLTTDCQPVAGAWLDFWQADGNGAYDNTGFRLRGHQLTGADGRYFLETVIPGLYPGRTEHIHVKVQPPGGAVLTTQLFFPDVADNQSDRIFSDQLVIKIVQTGDSGMQATFNFIVDSR